MMLSGSLFGSAQEPVGGSLYSVKRHGKSAAEIGLRVLSGESPGAIPIRESQDSAYMFDWRALKRWGLRESDLPSGSTVLFREVSVSERNKRIWSSVLIVILALSLLSAYLHYRAELKKARDAQVQLSTRKSQFAGHRRCVGRIRSGSEYGSAATRLDSSRRRTPKVGWD